MANIAGIVNEEEKAKMYFSLMQAGLFYWAVYQHLTKGEVTLISWLPMPFDAWPVGNHEFGSRCAQYGVSVIKSKIPILLGNIYYTDTNKTSLGSSVDHYRDGLKIGD